MLKLQHLFLNFQKQLKGCSHWERKSLSFLNFTTGLLCNFTEIIVTFSHFKHIIVFHSSKDKVWMAPKLFLDSYLFSLLA